MHILAVGAGLALLPAGTGSAAAAAPAHHRPAAHRVNLGETRLGYRGGMLTRRHVSRRHLMLGAGVAAAAAALLAVNHQLHHSSGTALPPTYGTVHMVSYLEGGAQPQTADQLKLVADRYSLVIDQPRRLATLGPQLHSINPNLLIVDYENGMFSTRQEPSNLPEAWFLHDRSGQRIHPARHPGNALMNPLSTAPYSYQGSTYHGWAAFLAHKCLADQTTDTTGCYLDMLGSAPLNPGYIRNGSEPIDPATNGPFTTTGYEDDVVKVAAAVRSALGSHGLVLANGYLNGPAYMNGTHLLNGHVNGGQAQAWMGSDAEALSAADWATDVQMLIGSGRAGSAMMVRYSCDCSGADVAPQREFALASYLIGNTGRAFFDFQHSGVKEFQDWSPLYDLDLGQPLQTSSNISGYYKGGLYQRQYAKGLVMVNPGNGSVPIRIGSGYHDLSGRAVHTLTVAPHSAEILLR